MMYRNTSDAETNDDKKKGAFYGKTISCVSVVSDDEDDYYSNVCTTASATYIRQKGMLDRRKKFLEWW